MSIKKIVNLKVNGIHCNGCAEKIKRGLDSLKMDHVTDVNIATGEVKIIFDAEKGSLSDIKSKVMEAGFQVESVEFE